MDEEKKYSSSDNIGENSTLEEDTSNNEESEIETDQEEEVDELQELEVNTEKIEDEKNNEIKEYDEVGRSKKKKFILIGLLIGILACLYFVGINTVSKYENKVYPGILVYNNDFGNLSKEDANKELTRIENKINQSEIIIKIKDKKHEIKVNELISNYNKDDLSNEIINYGKDQNTISKFFSIISKNDKEYKFDIDIDKNKIKEIVNKIEEEANKNPIEPKVIINGNNISYKEGEKGLSLDKENLIKEIEKSLKEINDNEKSISIEGKYIDINPKIDIARLKKVNTKISEYSTHYGGGDGRSMNIEIATKKLDNIILMPGDEFSYEKTVGPVEASNGYVNAPVIINGSLKDGIGGGVCQVSSTLYNTQLKAGLLPTERRNHSKPVNYVPRGLDATLATGLIDYKFKNTFDYPIVINTYTSKGNVYIEFWSNSEVNKDVTYESVSYANGNTADAYLYGYDKNGKEIYKKYIDKSVYR